LIFLPILPKKTVKIHSIEGINMHAKYRIRPEKKQDNKPSARKMEQTEVILEKINFK